jgi:hypothetical protein
MAGERKREMWKRKDNNTSLMQETLACERKTWNDTERKRKLYNRCLRKMETFPWMFKK